jgi:G-patch domain/OCRE domain/Zinc-finger double-stranded RNA-binding
MIFSFFFYSFLCFFQFNEVQMLQQLQEQQHQMLQQQQHIVPPIPQLNRMAAEVLQSARWSGNSGYPGQPPAHPAPPKPSGPSIAPGVLLSKAKPTWPPSFETDGGAYVFQAQSGSFLEPKSQFFYCPKSKLYYSCADGVYYSCVVLQNETAFMRFNPPLPLEPEGTVVLETVDKNAAVLDAARKPVVLSMGFNMGKGKNSGVKIINVASKKVLGDMAKWGSLQEHEEEAEKGRATTIGAAKGKGKPSTSIPDKPSSPQAPTFVTPPTFVPPPIFSNIPASSNGPVSVNNAGNSLNIPDPRIAPVFAATSAADAIALITGAVTVPAAPPTAATVATGDRVACLLCRRQFASQEQLLRHERESKLHKDNMMLAVQAASDEVARQLAAFGASSSSVEQPVHDEVKDVASSTEGYRDRASERRATYQQTSQGGSVHRDRDRERDRDRGRNETFNSVQKSEVDSQSAPSSSLQDVSNPGTQLLRKMGWNEGQGLGRGGTGAEESVGVMLASQTSNNNGKRISGVGGSSGAIPQVDYRGSGREYKESLLRAAKARYDQVSKQ